MLAKPSPHMIVREREDVDLHRGPNSRDDVSSCFVEMIGSVMSLWDQPERDMATIASLLVSIQEFLENNDFLAVENHVPYNFIELLDWILVHTQENERLCEICLDLLMTISDAKARTPLIEKVMTCEFWNLSSNFFRSGLQDSVLSLLCQLFDWFNPDVKMMLLDNLLPVCLAEINSESDSLLRFIYAAACYSRFSDAQVIAVSNSLIELLLTETDTSKLVYSLCTLFQIVDETNYKCLFFTEPLSKVTDRVMAIEAPDVLTQLLALFARLCQFCDESDASALASVNFSSVVHAMASNLDTLKDVRINGMNFLTNASTCPGIGVLLTEIPEVFEVLKYSFDYGSFDEKITACHLYNNLIDRENIARRVEMSTNGFMSTMLQIVSSSNSHRRLRRQVVHILRNTLDMSDAIPTSHDSMLDFLTTHVPDLDLIYTSTTDPKIIADIDHIITSLNV